jgi:hypothetical protein
MGLTWWQQSWGIQFRKDGGYRAKYSRFHNWWSTSATPMKFIGKYCEVYCWITFFSVEMQEQLNFPHERSQEQGPAVSQNSKASLRNNAKHSSTNTRIIILTVSFPDWRKLQHQVGMVTIIFTHGGTVFRALIRFHLENKFTTVLSGL